MNEERKKKLLRALPLVVVVLIFYVAVPLHWGLDTLSHDQSVARSDNAIAATYRQDIANAEAVVHHRTQWTSLLDGLKVAVPPTVDFSGLVNQLTSLTTTTGVTWTSGSLGAPTVATTAVAHGASHAIEPSPVAISMSVSGSSGSVAAFLKGIQHMGRLVVVKTVSISSSQPGKSVAIVTATAFLAR